MFSSLHKSPRCSALPSFSHLFILLPRNPHSKDRKQRNMHSAEAQKAQFSVKGKGGELRCGSGSERLPGKWQEC